MSKKIVWQWEQIDEFTTRVKVFGGWWLVKINKKATSVGSIFIPDQDWQWEPIEPYVDPQVVKANLAKDYAPSKD
jgi:hypothetical protein